MYERLLRTGAGDRQTGLSGMPRLRRHTMQQHGLTRDRLEVFVRMRELFCSLLHFATAGATTRPKGLLVAAFARHRPARVPCVWNAMVDCGMASPTGC
ncbi:MAG: hypothetical protein EXR86_03845 [Gammaproteobacteria bacterium]|nr:hypothetical protein [Gammaproteobacteria bacterium]